MADGLANEAGTVGVGDATLLLFLLAGLLFVVTFLAEGFWRDLAVPVAALVRRCILTMLGFCG